MDYCGFATTDGERATFGWLEHHSHAVDVVIDHIDDLLVCPLVGGYEAEVVSIWEGDEALADGTVEILGVLESLEIVTMFDVVHEEGENGIESEEECDGTQWISLKYSSLERKWI